MYENGRQLNRYANKKKHKHIMQQRYLRYPFPRSFDSWNGYLAHLSEEDQPAEYWKAYSQTGHRRYAKHCTNRVLRAQGRVLTDIPQRGGYRKLFDYWGYIF